MLLKLKILFFRRCIISNGTLKIPLSAWDVITCFKPNINMADDNCDEYAFFTIQYALNQYVSLGGIVTGGGYETGQLSRFKILQVD